MMMKRPMMKKGGKALKKVKPSQKGLKKLPRKVRNKMGYMKNGGTVMMVQGRGCGAIDPSKQKMTRVPRT